MKKVVVALLFFSILFSLTFLNGAAGWEKSTDLRDMAPLKGTTIYKTKSVVGEISVYGNKAAWVSYEDPNGTNANVYGYDGSIISLGTHDYVERNPSVGNRIVWEAWVSNTTISIESSKGTIYTGSDGPICPRIDGDNVIFEVGDGIKAYYNGKITKISDHHGFCPDISGDLAVYGPYVYSFKNDTEWKFSYDNNVESRISGDWIVSVGRNNFGKGVYVDIWNLNWKYEKIVWQMDVGEYYGLDAFDIDGNFVVWSYGGNAYLFNLVTMQLTTYYSPLGSIGEIDVGGGKLLWSVTDDYGNYYIVMDNAPKTPEYVDVVLTSKVSGIHDEFSTLLIIDSSGNRMGYDSSYHHYEEISGGLELTYGEIMRFRVVGNTAGLKYQVIGQHDGKYDLRIERHGATRGSDLMDVVNAVDIPISKGEIQQYVVDWSKLASKVDGAVEISIDSNGDGTFESTITTDSGEITEETIESDGSGGAGGINLSMGGITCLIAGIIGVIVIVLLVVLVLKKKK